ncbi:hypothetical protein NWE55_16400 [Myroides albus]|uniref:Uncharacterized protein n=1 Tax=Myroides albus TaxID=2562892 RepID=A0A6I3LP30_9FLAO|nr:hypothetical protein [Myroides albus]MTG98411.1 hypothetical protein [Myroides albus]UVD79677.1 hypothetical protein NWE55_16400 [Myroides albus]
MQERPNKPLFYFVFSGFTFNAKVVSSTGMNEVLLKISFGSRQVYISSNSYIVVLSACFAMRFLGIIYGVSIRNTTACSGLKILVDYKTCNIALCIV